MFGNRTAGRPHDLSEQTHRRRVTPVGAPQAPVWVGRATEERTQASIDALSVTARLATCDVGPQGSCAKKVWERGKHDLIQGQSRNFSKEPSEGETPSTGRAWPAAGSESCVSASDPRRDEA